MLKTLAKAVGGCALGLTTTACGSEPPPEPKHVPQPEVLTPALKARMNSANAYVRPGDYPQQNFMAGEAFVRWSNPTSGERLDCRARVFADSGWYYAGIGVRMTGEFDEKSLFVRCALNGQDPLVGSAVVTFKPGPSGTAEPMGTVSLKLTDLRVAGKLAAGIEANDLPVEVGLPADELVF